MSSIRTLLALATVAAGTAALPALAHANDSKLTLADLKQLVADKAYEEALQHLDDVAPTLRTADWIAVGGAAAAGYVAPLPTNDGSALGVIDAIDRHYPTLVKSPAYAKVRAEHGPAGLAGCLDQSRESGEAQDLCMDMGQHLVDGSGGDRALTLAVAKIGTEHGTPAAIVPVWKRLVGGADTSACKEADLSTAVLGGLDRAHDSPLAADARAVMATCWAQLEAPVVKAFDEAGKHSDFHRNTCDQLKAKQKLSSLQTKQCS